jgi:hypothetical protein
MIEFASKKAHYVGTFRLFAIKKFNGDAMLCKDRGLAINRFDPIFMSRLLIISEY